jgi:hypothetical protein
VKALCTLLLIVMLSPPEMVPANGRMDIDVAVPLHCLPEWPWDKMSPTQFASFRT